MESNLIYKEGIFKNKVLLMSGGTSVMLFKVAEDFMTLGGSVALIARRENELNKACEQLKTKTGGIARGYKTDIRREDEINKTVDKVLTDFGRIDVLVNGAAGNFLSNAENLSQNAFRTVMEIDTVGTFLLSKSVYLKFFAKNGGNIINISATLQNLGTMMMSHSSAAKAAVDALTRTLALEWGPKGVRVNGVAPGGVEGTEGFDRLTDIAKANSKQNLSKKSQGNDERNVKFQEIIPLQRLATRNDVSNSVLFLASEASSYITGQTIIVDGGQLAVAPNYLVNLPEFVNNWKAKF